MTPNQAKALALVAVSKIEAKSAAEEQCRNELRKTMVNDDEIEQIILAIIRQRSNVTDVEVQAILNEIVSIRFKGSCIDLVCMGLLDVDYDPTLPESDRLAFKTRQDINQDLRDAMDRRSVGAA